jgi:hypothetical protein
MKHRVSIVPLLLVLLALSACKPQTHAQDAVAYNDAIVDLQTKVVDQFDRFVNVLETYDSLGALQALEVALDTAEAATQALTNMAAFDKNTALRDAALNLVELYARGLDQDFRAILPILVSHHSTLTQLEQADSVRLAFSAEEDRLFAAVEQAQKAFAKDQAFEVTVAQP